MNAIQNTSPATQSTIQAIEAMACIDGLYLIRPKGDNMRPTIGADDLAGIEPCERFRDDGLYLLDKGNYPPAIYRIGSATTGKLWVINDNPAYPSHTVEPHQIRIIGQVKELFKIERKAV